MDDLVRKTEDIIRREGLISEGHRVLVGCSGGVDSVTLLFVLREISHDMPIGLGVAHVNHLLRGPEADRDEDFVRGLADRFSIPCYVKRVDVRNEARMAGKSIQHAGRDIRYGFFDEIADQLQFDRIAIAHNRDDQIETFLLRLIKGTGIRGLSSIPLRREKIVRPFLGVYRSEIESYAKTRAISFVEDSSNARIKYERNFVRREILPVMERLNPVVKERVFALLEDLTLINLSFDRKAEEFLVKEKRAENGNITIDIKRLQELDREVRFRVLSSVLREIDPEFLPLREHIRLIERVLQGRRPNLSAGLPRHTRVKKTYGNVTFTNRPEKPPVEGSFEVRRGINKIVPLGLTLDVMEISQQSDNVSIDESIAYLDLDKLGDLRVRTFVAGDRFVPLGMKETVKLKDFFIAQKIPREERRKVPLLVSGEGIVWVVGYRIDERYKVTEETRRVLRVTAKQEPLSHVG